MDFSTSPSMLSSSSPRISLMRMAGNPLNLDHQDKFSSLVSAGPQIILCSETETIQQKVGDRTVKDHGFVWLTISCIITLLAIEVFAAISLIRYKSQGITGTFVVVGAMLSSIIFANFLYLYYFKRIWINATLAMTIIVPIFLFGTSLNHTQVFHFELLLAWLSVGPVCFLYLQLPYSLLFIICCGILSLIAQFLHVSKSPPNTWYLWGLEIALILFRVIPIPFSYYCALAYANGFSKRELSNEIEGITPIINNLYQLDFDSLARWERNTNTKPRTELQRALLDLSEGLRIVKPFLPASIFKSSSPSGSIVIPSMALLEEMEDCTLPSTALCEEPVGPIPYNSRRRKTIPGQVSMGLDNALRRLSNVSPVKLPVPEDEKMKKKRAIIKPKRSLNTDTSLTTRLITLATIRFKGLHQSGESNMSMWKEISDVLVEVIGRYVRNEKGVLHSFEPGLFIAHWNAVEIVASHQIRACAACCCILQSLKRAVKAWETVYGHSYQIQIGITSGNMICGNSGSSIIKRFNIFSYHYPLSQCLALANNDLLSNILTTASVRAECQHAFKFRKVCVMRFEDIQTCGHQHIYELIGPIAYSEVGEWMYQIERMERSNSMTMFDEGFTALSEGTIDRAIYCFSSYLESYPNDRLAKKYLAACREQDISCFQMAYQKMVTRLIDDTTALNRNHRRCTSSPEIASRRRPTANNIIMDNCLSPASSKETSHTSHTSHSGDSFNPAASSISTNSNNIHPPEDYSTAIQDLERLYEEVMATSPAIETTPPTFKK